MRKKYKDNQDMVIHGVLEGNNNYMEKYTLYDEGFYKENIPGSYKSAGIVLGYVMNYFKPESIVDFGCGAGTWLKAAYDYGCRDIVGLDGKYVDTKNLLIDEKNFVPHDLSKDISLNRTFSLAMSLEVVEHIDEKFSDVFVNNICKHASIVLFSAAAPGQGGVHHVNERHLSYWRDKFLQHGYELLDCLRGVFWDNDEVEYWYRQNMVLFVKNEKIDSIAALFPIKHPIDIIHPLRVCREPEVEKHIISIPYIRQRHPRLWSFLLRIRKRLKRS